MTTPPTTLHGERLRLIEEIRRDLNDAYERGFRDAIDVLRAVPAPWAGDAADLLQGALETALRKESST
jgi:hypothetical protein